MSEEFNSQFREELPHLWRFACRLCRSTDLAEDLVQRTVLRGLEKSHQFREGSNLRSWLFMIMHSIWKNDLRSSTIRDNRTFSLSDSTIDTQRSNEDPEASQLFYEVINSVNHLPDAQRDVILLVCVEGYSYQETADILDIAIGTVMSRLARARLVIGEQFIAKDSTPKQEGKRNEN